MRRAGLAIGFALAFALGGAGLLSVVRTQPEPEVVPLFAFLADDYGADVCDGTVPAATGGTVTFTRATVASCVERDRGVTNLTSGQPAVEDDGLLLEPAATNLFLRSEAFGTSWTTERLTITDNATTAPDGTATAELFTDNGATGQHRLYQNPGDGVGNDMATIYAKAGGGLGRYLRISAGAGGVTTGFDLQTCAPCANPAAESWATEPMGDGWCRIGSGEMGAASFAFSIISLGVSCDAATAWDGDGGNSWSLWRAQAEGAATTGYGTSPVPTGAASVTRNATTASVPNPFTGETSWCIREKAAPNWGSWTKGNTQGLWQVRGDAGLDDTASAWVNATGHVEVFLVDSDGDEKLWTSEAALLDYGHDIRVCSDEGEITVYNYNQEIDGDVTGTGDGLPNLAGGLFHIGSLGSGEQITGRIADVCVSGSTGGCETHADDDITPASLGGGTYANPFVTMEPFSCVRAPHTADGELAGAGTAGQANSWVFFADGGTLYAQTWDGFGRRRERQTRYSFPDGGNSRVCFHPREIFMSHNDVPAQLWMLGDTSQPDAGSGLIHAQPAALRGSGALCAGKHPDACGTKPHAVAFLGDSLSNPLPTAGGPTRPANLVLREDHLPAGWVTYNYGSGGATMAVLTEDQWRQQAKQSRAWDYVVVLTGYPDISVAMTGAQAIAAWDALVTDIEASGAVVIAVTPTPWEDSTISTHNATKQGHYDDFMAHILGSGRIVIDAYSHFENAGDADSLDPSWNTGYTDGVHWNQLAQDWVASEIADEMGF